MRTGHSGMPPNANAAPAASSGHPQPPSSQAAPPQQQQQQQQSQHQQQQQQQQQQQPPSIGPGSNYFGGIMNANGNGTSQGPPLVAPTQMADHPHPSSHGGYPPSSQAPATVPPGSAPGYMNGSASQQQQGI